MAQRYDIEPKELAKAKVPHELFLTNLIVNHVLIFVSTLGLATSYPIPVFSVPVISVAILSYTVWRGWRSRTEDPWFVMCHWQIAMRRSKFFIAMLGVLAMVAGCGWLGYHAWGLMKELALALVGGIGILPTMITILTLIVLESDALHQARNGKLPPWIVSRYPNAEAKMLDDSSPPPST